MTPFAISAVLACLALSMGEAVAQTRAATDSLEQVRVTSQPAARAGDLKPGTRSLGAWLGLAHNSPLSTRLGTTHDRDLYLVGVRAGWLIASANYVALEYTVDLIPVAVTTGNPEYYLADRCRVGPCELADLVRTRHVVYGAGIAPIGLQLHVFRKLPVQLLLNASFGGFWFARPVPDPEATRFNFTADVGGAVKFVFAARRAVMAGYKYHHLSNGGLGGVNPGANAHVFYLGFIHQRR